MLDKERLISNASALGIELDSDEAGLLDEFCGMVLTTNEQFNLTAIKDPDEMEEKNALDCVTVLPFLPAKGKVADLGTGAGFPGVVIKLMRPELDVTLVEATDKKLKFASGAAASLGHPVTAVHMRGEEASRGELRESFDCVTARAVAALPALLEYALPLVKPGGILIAMKGADADREIEEAANALKELKGEIKEVKKFTLPTAGERAIVVVRKTGTCPARYPRAAKNIKKAPL